MAAHDASHRFVWLALGVIGAAALAAYANSFATPFVFDDLPGIVRNTTIRHLWPPWDVLRTPAEGGSATVGRPLVNVSLALNYAAGGLNARGYHVVNFLLHLLAAWTLFGVVRRTLAQPRLRDNFATAAVPLGTAVAWCLHPLQTESVTGVIQRTELLVGLFYLLTLYGFIRSTEPGASRWWAVLAVLACLCGMASKEVMVTAPLMVALYDRVFVAGSFARAWQSRGTFYSTLAGTWLLLALLVLGRGGTRGSVAGFGLGVTPWDYALTQIAAVAHYLKLSFWPDPLVLDYGLGTVSELSAVVPQALLLLLLVTGTVLALRR